MKNLTTLCLILFSFSVSALSADVKAKPAAGTPVAEITGAIVVPEPSLNRRLAGSIEKSQGPYSVEVVDDDEEDAGLWNWVSSYWKSE